jgi:hypothetical protein
MFPISPFTDRINRISLHLNQLRWAILATAEPVRYACLDGGVTYGSARRPHMRNYKTNPRN